MNETKQRDIVDYWGDAVVVNGDNYFADLEAAIERYRDDCYDVGRHGYVLSAVPEFIECCDNKVPDLSNYVERMIERFDENNPFEPTCFGEHADVSDLVRIVQVWAERQRFSIWEPNGKWLNFREMVRKDIIEWEENENPKHPIFEI